MKRTFLRLVMAILSLFLTSVISFVSADDVDAIAKESTLTISFQTDILELEIMPSFGGTFASSNTSSVSVSTDNFTGYSLFISTGNSTSLVNNNNDEIQSISSSVDGTTFSTNSAYNNKWGYKPSQYVTTNNNVDAVVQNSNYLPAPSGTGTLLAKTSAKNVTSDSYDLSFGARVDMSLPAGTYSTTYVLTVVPNSIVYNITYDDNATGTVGSMPSPNPQALNLAGGTPVTESYGTLSSAVPTLADKMFGGWCSVQPTYNSTTENDECSGTTYAAGDDYPIDQTADGTNITLYAIWLKDSFPMVWTQMGACEFHGATNGNITGAECQDYTNDKFIDTGIPLYSTANYLKDYEVHFTIDHYVPSENNGMADQQQTFVSDKLSETVTSSPYDGRAPGMIVRRSGDDIQIRSSSGHNSNSSSEIFVPSGTTTDVSVYRIDGVVYASINHGALIQIQNVSTFDQQFGLNTWFGAYPGDDCTGNTTNGVCTNAIRFIEATLSNMYIKLGDFNETMHTITFNANGGTPTNTIYKVIDGDTLGPLPTGVTRSGHVLMYWYSTSGGSNIATPETRPRGDITYYAYWLKEASQATFSNSSMIIPVNGTSTINVTNSAELEDYTFSSSDTSVATVDPTTGLVTGVGVGTTTITLTGTKSGTTATVSVTVSDSMVRVTFTTGQGSNVDPIDVEIGDTISELPISIRSGYTLEGWYTGADGTGTKLTTSTQINSNMTFIANWIVTTNVCRLADPLALHKETCSRTTSNGCRTTPNPGYSSGAEITYGKLPTDLADPTELKPGLAYTCDINANNEYDEVTERFYLLSTTSNTAALVWYKNIVDLSTNYPAAYTQLPDSSTWRNTNLIAQAEGKVTRYMKASEVTAACGGNTNGLKTKACEYLMEQSNYANTNLTDGIWLEKVSDASNGGRRIHSTGLSLGNVNPSASGSNNAPRPVIEIPLNMLERYSPAPTTYTITFDPQNETSSWDETITPGDDLSSVYPSSNPTYTNHLFQGWYNAASGGTQISSSTEPSGDTTYYAQWKGTVALATVASNSISVPANDTATVTVINAADLEGFTFSSSDTSVATIDSSTGVITPVAVGTTNISITGATSQTSNQIVTVTVTQPVAQHTITFNPHNGGSTWNETVNDGDDLSSVYPSPDPTYTDHIFQGWYTATSGGTLVTSSTVPDSSTTYHAQWLGTVALATFSSNSIAVQEGNTATITVTNSSDIEGYGFASLDSTVATVDASTGVVTGVVPGTTSIRMTGASSLTYVDIPVTVTAQPTYTIYFDPHNGESSSSATIVAGSTIGNNNFPADPVNTDPDMIFMGWYTAVSNGTLVDGSTTPTADGETYHAVYKKIVCRVETSSANLHTATRAQDSTPLTYGYIADNTTPEIGDAYNCDVDYDDTYSPVNERFYYLGTDNSTGNSALVAWNSYHDGAWAAGTSNDPIYTYANALSELPANTSGAWDNPGLIEQETGKAARFTERAEVVSACPGVNVSDAGSLVACDYLMEHTAYDGAGRSALWLMKVNTTQYRIHSGNSNRQVSSSSSGSSMVRPTIVVPYKLIEKYTPAPAPLDITNAVIGNSDLTVMVGQTLTIQVSNSASLESYTFSSDDSSIATVNSTTGVVTGVSVGTVDIIMTGTSSGLTKTIEIEVVADPDVPVIFDVSNDATRGYQDLSAQWAQSPVNLTTFNKDATINNSTWGDTSELSELQYWQAVRSNFVDNQCFIQTSSANSTASDAVKPMSALSNWTSGSVDCSKPTPYDTNTNAALTVRLNDAQGAVVAYADAGSGVIHNMIPGQTYYWEKTSDSSVYGYVTAVSNRSSTGTRWVDMDVVRNVRDLGGLPVTYTNGSNQTVTGTLAYGRLLRGEKMQNVNASVLTNLGITTEYNVGDEYQDDTHLSDYHLYNVIHYDFDYNSGDENNASSNYMKAWNAVTEIMTDVADNNKNIFFHCRVGADRTGTVAYLLEGLLGVPDEQRYEEYGLSNVSGLYDRTRYYKQKSSTNNLKFVYMMGYVQTTQDIYNWYMQKPGTTDALIQRFRAAMTVPTQ